MIFGNLNRYAGGRGDSARAVAVSDGNNPFGDYLLDLAMQVEPMDCSIKF